MYYILYHIKIFISIDLLIINSLVEQYKCNFLHHLPIFLQYAYLVNTFFLFQIFQYFKEIFCLFFCVFLSNLTPVEGSLIILTNVSSK